MGGGAAVEIVAMLVAGAGVFLLVLGVGLRLVERLLAREDPDPLEAEVFGKRQVRRLRRMEQKGSPSSRLTQVGAALTGGGLATIALVELLSRLL